MDDLFSREQKIYDDAVIRAKEIENGAPCGCDEFKAIVKEYGIILRQLRRITKLSDRTTFELNTSRLDLSDRVYYDALTGIYNRRYMDEAMHRIINAMPRSRNPRLSVLMIDVDFFKKYNDMYGHSAGDDCLKSVAEAIGGSLMRGEDFAARYGGEEFIVVLPDTGSEGARVIAERILSGVSSLGIPHEDSAAADVVTVSVGACFSNTCLDADSYIKRSDEALYISKQNGRNRYTFLEL